MTKRNKIKKKKGRKIMKDLNKISKKEEEKLSERRAKIWKMEIYMRNLSDERMKESEDYLIRKMDFLQKRSKVSVDMSSEKEYFVNKKRYLMILRNNLAETCVLIQKGKYKEIINNEDIDKLLDLIDKIKFKLLQIELPLESKFDNLLYDNKCAKDDTTH